jgi:signal transduction histidine kinase
VRGRRRARPLAAPLLVLAGFFVLRGMTRLATALGYTDSRIAQLDLGQLLDVLLIVALVAIMLTIERVLRGVADVEDSARMRADEYARAKRHYTQVVRHRMMNPIAAIRGSALTLRDAPRLEDSTRVELLDAIVGGCDQLEHVSLVPERRDELERDLDAVPRVSTDRRLTSFPDGPPGPS